MSSFPPKSWRVRFLQDMENIDCSLRDGDNVTMEALVAVRPAGGEEGSFKFTLAGPEMLRLTFPLSKILPGDAFADMIAEIEMKPGDQIRLAKNTVATTWWDFEELVTSQDAVVLDSKGQDKGDEFLTAIGFDKTLVQQSASRLGLCFRWVLGTWAGSKQVVLIAQVNNF